MKKNKLLLIGFILYFYTLNNIAQNYTQPINEYLSTLQQKEKLHTSDLNYQITSNNISRTSDVAHVYFSQEINGYIILNTESSIHILPNGKKTNSNNRFIKYITGKSISSVYPTVSAIEAIEAIAKQMNYKITSPIKISSVKQTPNQETEILGGGFAKGKISLRLKYLPTEDNRLVLVWEVFLTEKDIAHAWSLYVDANNGEIINKTNNIIYCTNEDIVKDKELNYNTNLYDIPSYSKSKSEILACENCYEVFAYPLENPYYGTRTTVANPANSIPSPYGWHSVTGATVPDYQITSGNNIVATTDQNYSPNGGGDLDFTNYPYNDNYSQNESYSDASITNVFYWANIYHDVMYMYGFDEASGNFQNNNFNRGGRDSDAIDIDGQVNSLNCNAGIWVFPDGTHSNLLMGICDDKDADFDNVVIIHEYTHGLVHRLIGGADSGSCLYGTEAIDEGYSDWYGLMFTINSEDQAEDARGFASFFFNKGTSGGGVRTYPYSTDLEINPTIYQNYPNQDSRYNWVWASALWEITWELINVYGFNENIYDFTGDVNQDAGNIRALAIVTESLKLLNCNPTIIKARDAVIMANQLIYNGENECLLWDAFAKRGLGFGAQPHGVSSFETIPKYAVLNASYDEICLNSNINEENSGGIPVGGFYSGNGVTDNGDGLTFSFDPLVAGLGTHTITYEIVGDLICSYDSSSEDTIIVFEDTEAPVLSCLDDATILIPSNENSFTITDYSVIFPASDNCGTLEFTQYPSPGTQVGVGEVIIELEAEDSSGNFTNCSFVLTIKKEVGEIDNLITITPNPTSGDLILSSVNDIRNLDITIFDISGKKVKSFHMSDFNFEARISVDEISSGMYFIKINTGEYNLVKRFIKN